ncbi:MAG: hypothetical protein KDA90_23035 [Planctomycetaceae bacterium]|nr:hypothetical protein [Planctomycetaceae bacterium]
MRKIFLRSFPGVQWVGVVERIGWLLVRSVWQFGMVALLVFLLDRCLRGASASSRYVTLLAAMLLIVVAPVATWLLLPSEATSLSPTLGTGGKELSRLTGMETRNPKSQIRNKSKCQKFE